VNEVRRFIRLLTALFVAALMVACASRPPAPAERDGPEPNPPSGLERLPDAEPRVEPLRAGGPNKPYEVLGVSYTPMTNDGALRETGLASWYGRKFQGRRTASGEPYDMYAMTAAHKTMPIPSYARVSNPANGREVFVRINDRGPFAAGRVIDLSYTAALKLGLLGGVAPVVVERLTNDDIRAGLWRRDRVLPVPEPEPLPSADDPLMALAEGAGAADSVPAPGFWLQLGAFRQRDGANQLHRRVQREADWLTPLLGVFADRSLFRVQAGPYPSRDEALGTADRLRATLSLTPLLVERR
jgi:rare lipoprotein A